MSFQNFLKSLLRSFLTLREKPAKSRRSPQIESLETREMLAVSILSSPVTAYAQQDNPAEIRFELTNSNDAAAQVEFVAKQISGSALDPSKLTLKNLSTGQTVALGNIVDGTTTSSGTASLKSGSYAIIVAADAGSGNFTLDILQEKSVSSAKTGLDILVAAAISQQQTGWSYRIAHFNALLTGTAYAGAASAKSILSTYPEVDVNGDGKVDNTDSELAKTLLAGTGSTTSKVSAVSVVAQDLSAPTITVGLKNDTGTVNDKITTDATIVGRVTDASGIKSASYKLDNGSWVALSLDASGNYTIPSSGVATGSHTVTINATDAKGNTTDSTCTFTLVASTSPGNIAGSAVTSGDSGTAKVSSSVTVQSVNGSAISAGKTVTLADNKGTVALTADGTLTFTPGSYYTKLVRGETETIALSIVSKDAYGHSYSSTVSFSVAGRNSLPTLTDPVRPNLNVNENSSGTLAATTLLDKWTDPDDGAILSITSTSVASVSCSNSALNSKYSAAALGNYVTLTSSGVKLDATSSFFDALGAGETLTITVAYKVKDQFGTSGDTGYLTFTVIGQNDAPVFTTGNWTVSGMISNDYSSPVKSVHTGFAASDADDKDSAALRYSYSNVNCGTSAAADGLITNFNTATGVFQVDTSKLANRDAAGTITMLITVGSAEGGTVSKTLTIHFAPETTAPTVPNITATVTETQSVSRTVTPTVKGSAGYTTSDLTLVTETGYGNIPSGVSLDSLVSLGKNSDGSLGFMFNPGANFEYLKAGETLRLKLRYTMTDTQYGTVGAGFIELTINGTATSPKAPGAGVDNAIGAGGQYASTESGGSAPSVTVPKSDILAGWTLPDGNSSYSLVPGTAIFSAWSGNATYSSTTNPIGTTSFGSINVDASGNLVFTPNAVTYAALGQGQWIDLAVDIQIRDSAGNLVPGGTVLFRVNGSNDPPTLVFNDFTWTLSETAGSATLDLTPFVADLDHDDSHHVVKINGATIVANQSLNLDNGATIKYLGGLKIQYILNGKFEYLSKGHSAFDEIFITITDGTTESLAAKLNVEIQGVHTPIRLVSDATVTKTMNVNDLDAAGQIDTIQVWKDSNDTLKYTVVCTGSDGATYKDLFTVDAAGKLLLNPTKIATLNKNLTYTVAVTIENANTAFGDQALSVTYTLDFVHRAAPAVSNETFIVSQNDVEGTRNLAATYKTGNGYRHEVVLTTNGTSIVLTAGTDYTLKNGVFTFLSAGKFAYLQTGESVDLAFTYKIIDTTQGDGDYFAEATLTVTVRGENDAPVFTTPTLTEALDSTATEIQWKNFFTDVDANDTLTLTGINGIAFNEHGRVTASGIGEFYLDNAEKLWFTPDASFNSLKKDVLANVLKVTLNVADSKGATAIKAAQISLQVKGTNKPPVVTAVFVQNQDVKTKIVIDVSKIATDINGDALRFESIKIGNKELNSGIRTIRLESGTTITLANDLKTLTIDGTTRHDFLAFGSTEIFSFNIVVADEYDILSTAKTVTTALNGVPATAPAVVDRIVDGVTEDDAEAPAEIVLSDCITDSNVPYRSNGNGWYTIHWNGLTSSRIGVNDLNEARLSEIAGFCNFENGIVSFNAPAGYFDFLNENETLTLTFTYTVTDNTHKDDRDIDLATVGTITVEIEGVNDAPMVDGLAEFDVTLSQTGTGGEIAVGDFTTSDADEGDIVTLSVGRVSGTKNGVALDAIPVFEFDGNDLKTTKTNMPELAPGEYAEFTIEIVATDKFAAETTKTVVVRVYAKTLASATIDGSKLNASEGVIVKSTPIIVADTADVFRDEIRNNDDWYNKPTVVAVTVPTEFQSKITDASKFFSVGGNSTDGYSLDFTGTKADFAFLREGETLEFSVTINVADKEYDAVTTTNVTVTVTGVGDAHTIDTYTDSFDYWANQRADQPNVFHPGYDAKNISDLDWKSEYAYSLQNTDIDATPVGFDSQKLEKLVSVDAETGEIRLDETGLTGLKAGFRYTLTVRIASTGEHADKHYVDVEIVLNIKVVDAPTVDPIIANIDENGTVSETVGITAPSDNVNHSYTISNPSLNDVDFDYTGPLPDGFDWNTILDGLASIKNGKFEFNPNAALDFLPKGSTLILTYTFTVSDDDYIAATSQEVIITITGVNNRGTAATGYKADGVHEIGSTTKHEVFVADIADLVQDVDLGDSHTLVSIDGIAIAYNTWTTIPGKGEFYYYDGTLGSDGLYYGGSLKYRPSAPEFESLRFGTENDLAFKFVLQDDSGVLDGTPTTGEGSFTITVSGTNKMPVVNSGEQRSVDEGEVLVISASKIASDVNNGDELRFYKVNGKTGNFQLADGTTVRFIDGGKFLEIDTRTRDASLNMLPGDTPVLHSLSIVVADDSGADNFYSLAKSLAVTIVPVDEGPTMSGTHEFGVSVDGLKDDTIINLGYVDFSDPDTPESEYDFSIVYNGKNPGFGLKANEPTRIYFIFDSKYFVEGVYTFQVVATLASDPNVTCATTVSVTFSQKKAPAVSVEYPEVGTRLSLTETDDSGSIGVTVTDPNGEENTDWYTVTNIRCVNGVLPEGATFEYDPTGNRFVFNGGGAFEFLQAGEAAMLTFEFTVRNNLHKIDTVTKIFVDIAGSNNRPEADDYSAMLNIPDNTTDGIRFYLSDLASDRDADDTLRFHTVCGEKITKDGKAVTLKRGEDVLGYITWKSNEKGDYLHFMPNGYFVTLRHLETETAWFEYTVIDNSGDTESAVSNTGTISFNVVGTNKKPVIHTTEGETREDRVHEITAADIASDMNTGDSLRIVGFKYDGNIHMIADRDQEPISLTLDSGATLTLHGDGRLVYNPTTRHRNMSAGDTDFEELELIVTDDSGDVSGNSVSEWTKFTLEIKGVNAAPVDLLPNVTEYVTELQNTVYTLEIDLREHFIDVDENDALVFSIKAALDKLGFLVEEPVIAEDGYTLVLRFMTLVNYTNDFDLSALRLTIVADDGIETVEKTLSFRVTQQYTVSLDVIATPGASGTAVGKTGTPPAFPTEPLAVAADDEYYIEVWASDLLNGVIADGMSGGLASVAFSLYWTSPDLVVEYEALGVVEVNSIGIRILAEGLDLNTGLNGNDVLLLRLKVTADGEGAVVGFQIDPASVQVKRQGEDGSVHESQVDTGATTVTHFALDDEEDDLFGILAGYQLARV